jgi:hypothetical protein
LGRVILVEVTKKVTFYILCWQIYSLMHRLETFMLFTFIPSLRFCELPTRLISLLKTHLIFLVKFSIDSLAPSFLYWRCHLCLYNRHPPRTILSYHHETHRTRSPSSSRQWDNRMGLCLCSNGKRSSFTSDWRDGFKVGD